MQSSRSPRQKSFCPGRSARRVTTPSSYSSIPHISLWVHGLSTHSFTDSPTFLFTYLVPTYLPTLLLKYYPEARDDPIDLSDEDVEHQAAAGGYPQPVYPGAGMGAGEEDPIVLSDGE